MLLFEAEIEKKEINYGKKIASGISCTVPEDLPQDYQFST